MLLCAALALCLCCASLALAQAPTGQEPSAGASVEPALGTPGEPSVAVSARDLAGAAGQLKGGQPSQPEVLVSGARIIDFGEFSSTVERRDRTATVADGIKDQARDFALVKRGALMEARLGSGIGIRYQLLGAPRGTAVQLDVVVRHPAIINPSTRQPMTHSSAQYERSIGQVAHSVWSFDTPASLLPGDYAIELWHRGRLLVRQAFKVTVRK